MASGVHHTALEAVENGAFVLITTPFVGNVPGYLCPTS